MPRLSLPIQNIAQHYDVVVIGSGYGGGIAASRLARSGKRVCVLERGKEFQPGEYPDNQQQIINETQINSPQGHIGPRTGLYDVRVNREMNVFLGCGLGGTSLVNANVSIIPDERVFRRNCWPAELQGGTDPLLLKGYQMAREMLRPVEIPSDPRLSKLAALQKSANFMNKKFYPVSINVTFQDGVNSSGVMQRKCQYCGDCMTGCNYSAKNTVLMNYLPDARNHGAEIYTQVSVRTVERKSGAWVVHCQLFESGLSPAVHPLQVTGDIVVLSAGTLGSTEILMRSKAAGLSLSDQLGQHFTGNGDVLGFGYNTDDEINGIGFPHQPSPDMKKVGPCITGVIDMREAANVDDGMIIEDGSVAGGFGPAMPLTMSTVAALIGVDTDSGLQDLLRERSREWESFIRGPYHGAIRNTQTYLVMAHDDSKGRMYMENDQLRISWPGVGDQPIFRKIRDRLTDATKALGGTFVRNPMWSRLFGHDLMTVHPLGGCVMASSAEQGVVNERGQVFSDKNGKAVYDNLYVSDGSVVPCSLGVNPLLTISALAERCCSLIKNDRGWPELVAPQAIVALTPVAPVGVQFTETMHGFFSPNVKDDFKHGEAEGRAEGSAFQFWLTISADNLDAVIADSNQKFKAVGSIKANVLSGKTLQVTAGDFYLFKNDPLHVETKNMIYRLPMTSEDGKNYFMEGIKYVHRDSAFDAWADTTTLYITVHEGVDETGKVVGKGILILTPEDFYRQMNTIQVTNTSSPAERMAAIAKFGRHFGGVLFDAYGDIFARPNYFNPKAPPRRKRPLRVSPPEVHFFKTADNVQLRLLRYKGGSKGPVILSHGLGVSSSIFSTDLISTNLLEYLHVQGYDVWLLDYRASIDLEASRMQSTGDDIALKDYPAAVAYVRRVAAVSSVQMVVHCYGSTTFVMAMLAGLQGVRSAVCSQIGAHIVAPAATRFKTGIHLPSFLKQLGIDSLSAYVNQNSGWLDKLVDAALRFYPVTERCNSPVCHRITFLYAPLYEHANLNAMTHDYLHEMFGVANISAFEHLGVMTNLGHISDKSGHDVYLPHIERLKIPITFIHGAENECFLPESTELTYKLLCDKNGKDYYTRYVIPHYGHIDCIFGKDAANDVYPLILKHLERTLHGA